MNNSTEGKQVNIHPQGVYYFCPHCNSHMKINYKSKYCPDCGSKLLWEDANEFQDINNHSCHYEDTDEYCKYYHRCCSGSKECEYISSLHILSGYAGRLTTFERRSLLFEKGWY